MDINSCYLGTVGLRELALYSHIIPAIATMVLGIFALLRAPDTRKAGIFFAFTTVFSLWLIADMVNWVVNDYFWVAATWAPLDFVNIVFYLLLVCFVFYDVFDRMPNRIGMGVISIVAIIPFVLTVSGNAVFEFNQPSCEMIGNDLLAKYKFGVELLSLLTILALGVYGVLRARIRADKMRISLTAGSIVLFLGIFAGAEFISTSTEVYETMLYTLFVLPVFVLFLTIAITHFGTLRLGDASVRVLFYIFLILAATQFFFVGDMTEFFLSVMSFGVVGTLGVMLYLASEREMHQRQLIQKQETELQIINAQQENLLHFISHEIKGFLTDGQNAFAGIVEGDFGETSPPLKKIATTALGKMRQGVDTVMNILDASNLKKGMVTYTKAPFNFTESLTRAIETMRAQVVAKGLELSSDVANGILTVDGDRQKIEHHIIRNLIDNAIRYTPGGSIHISLKQGGRGLVFSVSDTGVGISEEDHARLFTEGGHGKESIKVNVDSTGYGLFIAKQVVEAHGGAISAVSEGQGKGSTFIVELPLVT